MTLTEAVVIIRRIQQDLVIQPTPDFELFKKLDFIKTEIISSQQRKKKK